MEHVIQKDKE